MTTTYSTDADILLEDRTAANLLDPDLDPGGVWDRHREATYAAINDALALREPPVEGGAGLKRCEIYGVLARAYKEQASTPGDLFWQKYLDYHRMHTSQLMAYRGESADTPGSIHAIPVWRS